MTATKPGVLFEQPFLQIEAQLAGFIIQLIFSQFSHREFCHCWRGKQHVIQRFAAQLRFLCQQFFGPHFFCFEATRELHQLPQIRLRFARCFNLLTPELCTAFSVTVGTFFLYPHRSRQDQVSRQGADRRVRIGDNDEVARIAPARHTLLIDVRTSLHVVGTHRPVDIELAIFQRAVLCHGVQTDFCRNGP